METQNSRKNSKLKGEIPKLKEKSQEFGKFYSKDFENNKINVKLSLFVLNLMLTKNGFLLKVQFCRRFSQKLMSNSIEN